MYDSGVACVELAALATLARRGAVTNKQVVEAVGRYEAEMILRVFG